MSYKKFQEAELLHNKTLSLGISQLCEILDGNLLCTVINQLDSRKMDNEINLKVFNTVRKVYLKRFGIPYNTRF